MTKRARDGDDGNDGNDGGNGGGSVDGDAVVTADTRGSGWVHSPTRCGREGSPHDRVSENNTDRVAEHEEEDELGEEEGEEERDC